MTAAETGAAPAAQHTRLGAKRTAATAAHLTHALYLAATPTFAVMALLTSVGGDAMPMLCSSGSGAFLVGMLPMYLLMSLFHLPPWLKLIARRHDARRSHDYPRIRS